MDIYIFIYEEFLVQKFSEAAYCLPSFRPGKICFMDELLLVKLHSIVTIAAVVQQPVRAKQRRVCALTSLECKGTTSDELQDRAEHK